MLDDNEAPEDKIGDAVIDIIGCGIAAVLLIGFAVATLVKVWS